MSPWLVQLFLLPKEKKNKYRLPFSSPFFGNEYRHNQSCHDGSVCHYNTPLTMIPGFLNQETDLAVVLGLMLHVFCSLRGDCIAEWLSECLWLAHSIRGRGRQGAEKCQPPTPLCVVQKLLCPSSTSCLDMGLVMSDHGMSAYQLCQPWVGY